jgi:hypothetical protein
MEFEPVIPVFSWFMVIHALELHDLQDGEVMYVTNSITNNKQKLICLHS